MLILLTQCIPPGFCPFFEGAGKEVWELLKHGSRAWAVRVVDNQLCDLWCRFKRQHKLRFDHKIIWGCERKWIFEIIILDSNGCQQFYNWSNVNQSWTKFNPCKFF